MAWTQVTINFETSHLIFPTIIGVVLALLFLTIVIRDRTRIAGSGAYWREVFANMDKARVFGTLVLTVVYFGLMVPVGDIWPNTGMGFLICSVPYVFAVGVLYLLERGPRAMIPVAIMAVVAPLLAWWLFSYIFFLTLP